MSSICNQRTGYWVSVAFVAGLTIFAVVTVGVVQASAFLPVFLGMHLLERQRAK